MRRKSNQNQMIWQKLNRVKSGNQAIPIINKAPISYRPVGSNQSGTNWIRYGDTDALPSEVLYDTWRSPTAKACLDITKKFIQGLGFEDEAINDIKVNEKGDTYRSLLSQIALSVAYWHGVAIRVVPDYLDIRKPPQLYCIGVNEIRRYANVNSNIDRGNYFIYSPYFCKPEGYTRYNLQGVPAYYEGITEEELGQEFERQVSLFGFFFGYIHLEYNPDFQTPDYPVPSHYSGLEQMQNQVKITAAEAKLANTAGMPAAVITVIGTPDNSGNNNGVSEYQKMVDGINSIITPETNANAILLTADNQDELPKIDIIGTTQNLKDLSSMKESNEKSICKAWSVPPILLNLSNAGALANASEFKNSLALFMELVKSLQDIAIRAIRYCDGNRVVNYRIKPIQPFNFIDNNLLDVLTPNEKRQIIGYSELKETEKTTLDSLLTLPDSISSKLLETLTVDEQRELIGLPPVNIKMLMKSYSLEEKEDIYQTYFKEVNMTYTELKKWDENPCSKKASENRAPINRNLELLNINKADWTDKHFRWANQTIAFLARMKEVPAGDLICDNKYSKRDISLMNWAFNPFKK